MFALLLAAVAVDLGHEGLDSAYHVRTQSRLAVLYNDSNVLENSHAAELFRICGLPQCDLMSHLASLGVDSVRGVREKVIEAILATNLERHFGLRGKFRQQARFSRYPNAILARFDAISTLFLMLFLTEIPDEWEVLGQGESRAGYGSIGSWRGAAGSVNPDPSAL